MPLIALLVACHSGQPIHFARRPPATTQPTTGDSADVTSRDTGSTASESGEWVDVSTESIACGVRYDGTTPCYGSSAFFTEPESFPSMDSAVEIEMSTLFGCTIDREGEVACFGCEQLGSDDCEPPAGVFTRLHASAESMCAVRQDDIVVCWGAHDTWMAGPVGNYSEGDTSGLAVLPPGGGVPRWSPAEVEEDLRPPSGLELLDIAIGSTHVCALHLDGMAECWGRDSDLNPYPQPGDSGPYVDIDSSGPHTCARKATGESFCWAPQTYLDQWPEILAPGGESFVQIDTGWFNTCGLRADGTVRCWGKCCGLLGEWPVGF